MKVKCAGAVILALLAAACGETRSVEYVILPADKIVAATPDDAGLAPPRNLSH